MSKHELTHEEAFAALDAVALDALEANERDAVLAHTAWCAECRAELKALRAAASHLAFAAPVAVGDVAASRERIRARLAARVAMDATAQEIRRTPVSMPAVDRHSGEATPVRNILEWRRVEWIAAAASVLLAVTLTLLAFVARDRHNLKETLGAQLAFDQQAQAWGDSLRTVVASRDSMIAGLLGRDVSVMRLTSGGARAPFALMFWDKVRNTWTLSAHNMPPLRPGRTYQLWLVTAGAKISAGTFDPTNGDAVIRATYPLSADALRALAVTEEQTGGAPQPTSTPIIAVSAQ